VSEFRVLFVFRLPAFRFLARFPFWSLPWRLDFFKQALRFCLSLIFRQPLRAAAESTSPGRNQLGMSRPSMIPAMPNSISTLRRELERAMDLANASSLEFVILSSATSLC
jgi:hypothetical protein